MSTILHECNLFITINKTAFEYLQDLNNIAEMWIILNPHMCLLLKQGADRCHNNLPTIDKFEIIIPNEDGRASFCDIVLAC